MVSRPAFEGPPTDRQEVIRAACHARHEDMKVECDLLPGRAMETLRIDHEVEFRRMNRDILEASGRAAGEVIEESCHTGDDINRRIRDSDLASRADTMRHLGFNAQVFPNARTIDVPLPGQRAT